MTKPTLGATFELDRQGDRRADAAHLAARLADPSTRFVGLVDNRPVVQRAATGTGLEIAWLTASILKALCIDTANSLFLGSDRSSGAGLFAISLPAITLRALRTDMPEQCADATVDLRELASQGLLAEGELAIVGLAKSLFHWHDVTRCCGRCGAATRILDGGWKRRCWSCGREHFPRLDPVVIMLVIHPGGHHCLLAHEGRFRPNMFSALAGYIEAGEDVEHAVRREVFEETRVEVGDVQYHASQPWAFPHTLMIGCLARAKTEVIVPDATEIVEARWFSRPEAQAMLEGCHPDGLFVPGRQAIAHTLIQHFARVGTRTEA